MSLIKNQEYRPDIDGLRAIAVSFVVLYHAFPTLLHGGFVGVDIFFVISGYLISGIILKSLANEDFSYIDFYVRRIRRIFPSLILVLSTSCILGWLFLFPSEFKLLGKHILAGAGFVSNFVLWNETGYFDAASELKPLLHLWSLGIEEQFYIFFPLFLGLLWNRPNKLLLIITTCAGLSFLINVSLISRFPTAIFYNPLSRVWELLIGSMLAYVFEFRSQFIDKLMNSQLKKNILSFAGCFAIVIALSILNKSKPFPGAWALLPTFGAIFIIIAGPSSWLNRKLLAHPILVFIGLISYPLYLWHWVLLSFIVIIGNGLNTTVDRFIIIVLSFSLAFLTYKFYEKPIRHQKWPQFEARVLVVIMTFIGILGATIYHLGPQTRLGESQSLTRIFNAVNDWDFPNKVVFIKGGIPEKVVFIGDSFIEQYYPRIKKRVENSNQSYSVIYAGAGGCPPLPDVNRIADPGGCKKVNDIAYGIARSPDVKKVVFGSAWHYFYPINYRAKQIDPDRFQHDAMLYAAQDSKRQVIEPGTVEFENLFAAFGLIITNLIRSGKEVYIVLPSPISDEFDPSLMIDRINGRPIDSKGVPKSLYLESFLPIIKQLQNLSKETGAKLLDPSQELCPNNFCNAFYKTEPIYKDIGHIRPYFARDHMTLFDDVILVSPKAK